MEASYLASHSLAVASVSPAANIPELYAHLLSFYPCYTCVLNNCRSISCPGETLHQFPHPMSYRAPGDQVRARGARGLSVAPLRTFRHGVKLVAAAMARYHSSAVLASELHDWGCRNTFSKRSRASRFARQGHSSLAPVRALQFHPDRLQSSAPTDPTRAWGCNYWTAFSSAAVRRFEIPALILVC